MQFVVCGVACLAVGLVIEPVSGTMLRNALPTLLYGGLLSVGVGYTMQVVAQRDAAPGARGRDLQHGRRVRGDRRLGRARRNADAARARGLRADAGRPARVPVAAERRRPERTKTRSRRDTHRPYNDGSRDFHANRFRQASSVTSTTVDPAADLLRERAAHYATQAALFLRDQASTASHDLRSPLNAMHSWAYVLERQLANADPNPQRALAGIRTGIDQQVALIDDVLDAPRAETRIARRQAAAACAARAARRHDRTRPFRARRRTAGRARRDAAGRRTVATADRERIAQALWTMLTAAVEASTAGSRVTLRARDGLQFTARAPRTVNADTLADPAQPHAFESFARREMLRERDAKRVAWTLALCQRVALAHGGTFTHDAFVDGATATITLSVPGEAPVSNRPPDTLQIPFWLYTDGPVITGVLLCYRSSRSSARCSWWP